MQKSSVKAVRTSMSRKLRRFGRLGDTAGLRAYMAGDFPTDLAVLPGLERGTMVDLAAAMRGQCAAKSKLPKPGSKRAKWDAAMIAKFKVAYAKTGSDEGAAILCGITRGSADLARRRHIDAPATAQYPQAA